MATDEEYENAEESSSFLSNIRRNLSVVTINEYIIYVLVGLTVLLMSGIVFVLSTTPEVIVSSKSGTTIIFNVPSATPNAGGLDHQYVLELIIVAGLFAIGIYGLYLIKNSTSYIDDQRMALEILALGTTLFLVAASILFFVYMYKMTGHFPYFGGLG